MKKLNLETWGEWRRNTEAEIGRLKAILHTPGHMGTTTEWLTLFDLQDVATRIYMLRAETRGEGRLHCTQRIVYKGGPEGTTLREMVPVTREDQRKLIASYMPGQSAEWLWKDVPDRVTVPACDVPQTVSVPA